MHAKTDSEVTSLAASSPPRSPPRRPIYYVMSPAHSHHDPDRASFGGSTPGASPLHPHHHRYSSSPIHHSRESSATRLSASLKYNTYASWRKLQPHPHHRPGNATSSTCSDDDGDEDEAPIPVRCYVAWFVLGFILLFTLFSLILWGASKSYKPDVFVKSVEFQSYDIHAGTDITGVPTKMLSINSTVRIAFRNPATFFGVHVSSTPFQLYFSDLKIATGLMKEFYQSRKSGRVVAVAVAVGGRQVPLYGGGAGLRSRTDDGGPPATVAFELSFTLRARAYVLGHLVKSKFYRRVRCTLRFREDRLGKRLGLADGCDYRD